MYFRKKFNFYQFSKGALPFQIFFGWAVAPPSSSLGDAYACVPSEPVAQ